MSEIAGRAFEAELEADHVQGAEAAEPLLAPEEGWAQRSRQVVRTKLNFLGRRTKWAGSSALQVISDFGFPADGMVRRGAEVTAVDTRPEMIAAAQQRSLSQGYRVNYLLAEAGKQMPVPSEAFDIVLCDHVFDRGYDRPSLLGEMRRVLKPHGLLLFTFVNGTLPARLKFGLNRALFAPGLPPSIFVPTPVNGTRLRKEMLEAGFTPHRMAGLGLRGFGSGMTPIYKAIDGGATIMMGTARKE